MTRRLLNLPQARQSDIAGEFYELIEDAHLTYGRTAVVLIDENDKPILDNILNPDKALELREGLKNLYSTLKDADQHLRMGLLTGVSKFSKVSLFSGLNNLRDITLSPEYATICGYTDNDIDRVFGPEINELDRDMVRDWYNGYRWGGLNVTSVYNPFDVLLLLQERRFGAYWFETATPTFLVDMLKERGVFTPALDQLNAKIQLLDQFDVDDISTECLLFQTGYLTVKDVKEPKPGLQLYTLGFPNLEVESSLNDALLPALGVNRNDALKLQFNLFEFKVVEQLPDGKALAQLIERRYAEKYLARDKPIHLVGVEFSAERRDIVAFDVQTLTPAPSV